MGTRSDFYRCVGLLVHISNIQLGCTQTILFIMIYIIAMLNADEPEKTHKARS